MAFFETTNGDRGHGPSLGHKRVMRCFGAAYNFKEIEAVKLDKRRRRMATIMLTRLHC
jgi:hypothetical protein